MVALSVNVDHVATIREARKAPYPDPVTAAQLAELAGADGITVHIRADRRHIRERDIQILRQVVRTRLNMEISLDQEIVRFALEQVPDIVTLVPERPEEVTTEGGLNVIQYKDAIAKTISLFEEREIEVSLFIDPDLDQIKASHGIGARTIEINTGRYADAPNRKERDREYSAILDAVKMASKLKMNVAAGHGLHLKNVGPIAGIPGIRELNIGHALIGHAIYVGMDRAVREMMEAIEKGRMLEV